MSNIACVFPGQGAQSVGMGKDLYDNNQLVQKTFGQIDAIAGRSLSGLCFSGPEQELKRTINTQPTILAVSLAAWQCYVEGGGPKPAYVAGHSLGEFSALVAAGALSLEAAVRLVDKRARLMEACPPGAMSAVIGMAAADLEAICRQVTSEAQSGSASGAAQPAATGASRGWASAQPLLADELNTSSSRIVIVANFNTHEQLVISGSPAEVARAGALAKEQKAKVIALPVGGAFHSPLMSSAAGKFEQELSKWTLNDAQFSVVQNVDARAATAAAELKSKLARQMPSAVAWCASIEYMLSQGVKTFIEIGPGKALTGMIKKIDCSAAVFNIFDKQSLDETLAALHAAVGV